MGLQHYTAEKGIVPDSRGCDGVVSGRSGVKAIPGSTDYTRVTAPVFSPDSRSSAFHADGAVRRIAVTGETAVTLARADAPYGIT